MATRSVRAALLGAALLAATQPAPALTIFYPEEGSSEERDAEMTAEEKTGIAARNLLKKINFSWDGQAYRDNFTGDRSRAFRPEETFFLNQFGLGYSDLLENGVEYEMRTGLRQTTDRTLFTNDEIRVTSLYGRAERKDVWRAQVGDVAANISRYAFNRSLEGAVVDLRHSGSWYNLTTTAVGGRTQRSRQATALRTALGLGAKLRSLTDAGSGPRWEAAYGYSAADDDLATAPTNAGLPDLHIDVHSFSYALRPLRSLTVKGENAWSEGTSNRRTQPNGIRGSAFFVSGLWQNPGAASASGLERLIPISIGGNLDEASRKFLTNFGAAAPDQRTYNANANFKFHEYLTVGLTHTNSRDNVAKTAANTNVSRTSVATLSTKPFLLAGNLGRNLSAPIRDLSLDADFRFNDRNNSTRRTDVQVEDYNARISTSAWGASISGHYQFQITDDIATPGNDARIQAWGVNVTRPFAIARWALSLTPTAGYRFNRDRQRIQGTANVLQNYNAGLGFQWEELAGEVTYTLLESNRTPGGNDFSTGVAASSLTYRPYAIPNFHTTLYYSVTNNRTQAQLGYHQQSMKVSAGYRF